MATIFIIDDNGTKLPVSSVLKLQEFAKSGFVLPKTKIEAKGRIVYARQIKELADIFNMTEKLGQNSNKTQNNELESVTNYSAQNSLLEEIQDQGKPSVQPPFLGTKSDESFEKVSLGNDNFQKNLHLLNIDENELERVARERIATTIRRPIRVIKTVTILGWIIGVVNALAFMAYGFLETEGIGGVGITLMACIVLAIPIFLAKVITSPIQTSINIQIDKVKDALRNEVYLFQLLKKNESQNND